MCLPRVLVKTPLFVLGVSFISFGATSSLDITVYSCVCHLLQVCERRPYGILRVVFSRGEGLSAYEFSRILPRGTCDFKSSRDFGRLARSTLACGDGVVQLVPLL